ncbi:MAG: high-potential iron-sulfur protein [Alphaproteobacteria bacterium]|nr:high-potential iron-sulfur protein [Alphaproteobacteria bacterium]MBU6471163.1 high-potential iron-sulfur protein [Alphaproteobacteria bacterium]MDE2074949.1 high-potential iron-sulfur protein [Alphaproteobacteria bacterium]
MQYSSKMSRRQLLHRAAIAAGSAGVAVATLAVTANPAQATKLSQAAAAYQPTAKGGQSCATCALFQPPAACSVVDGKISPSAWCKFYVKKN